MGAGPALALLEQSSDRIIDATKAALASTTDNKLRVIATMQVFYDYVANAQGAFRLVFESDLTNEPAVRAQVDCVTSVCADEITHVISEDTGLSPEASRLLAVSLVGMAQVSARYWLAEGGEIGRDALQEQLVDLGQVAGREPHLKPGGAAHHVGGRLAAPHAGQFVQQGLEAVHLERDRARVERIEHGQVDHLPL